MTGQNDVIKRSDVLDAYQAWIINREHELSDGWLFLKKRLEDIPAAKGKDWMCPEVDDEVSQS